MVLRGEDFGRLLDYGGRALMNGSSAPLAPLPCDGIVRKWPSVNQRAVSQ